MPFTTVTIVKEWPSRGGRPVNGTVTLTPSELFRNDDAFSEAKYVGTVQQRRLSMQVPATDDTGTVPAGRVLYWVDERIVGVPARGYWIAVSASAGTIDLATATKLSGPVEVGGDRVTRSDLDTVTTTGGGGGGGGTPTDGSVTNAKVAANAAISADKLADGATNKVLTATERTKLAGVATGATANSSDAQLRDRGTHTGAQAISTVTGLQTALDGKTALSVDGSPVSTYDLDTSPVAPGELVPPAYTQDEVDALIDGIDTGGGPWVPISDVGAETDFAVAWTPVTGLSVSITSESTANIFQVDLLLDLATYAANTGLLVINLAVDGSGQPVTFPIRIPASNFRLVVPCRWTVTGLSAGSHTLGIAAYGAGTTTVHSYQSGTGTTLTAERKA